MRVKLVFSCVLMLAALSQPALAVCVNRGGSVQCDRPPQSYPNATQRPDKHLPVDNPDLETTVLQPSVSSEAAAWVLMPESGTSDAATVLGCGSSENC
jgi:hypothetical protein